MIFRIPILFLAAASTLNAQLLLGPQGHVGTLADPKKVERLEISKPGIYENFLVDGGGASGNLVKITADNVTLRNCEIRNGGGNGIGIFADDIVIENCLIHHMLAGTFAEQADAHGISGRWGNTIVRNCDIAYCSGDSIQFDPDRKSSGRAVFENCRFSTGPLPAADREFAAGERPGENAFDSKTMPTGARCELKIKNCILRGFNQPAQIENMAALNLKENVDAEIENCLFYDNEIAFRVRGPGKRGGAHVTITHCAVYDTRLGVRAEDGIEILMIDGLGFGERVSERIRFVNGKATAGFEFVGEHDALPMGTLLEKGFPKR